MTTVYFDEREVLGRLQAARALRPKVQPIEGGTTASGAVFRIDDHEVFVGRRWQIWEGAYWCIIDFTSPLTGYVEERHGGTIVRLKRNGDGSKILLMPEDEEALYHYFAMIVESDLLSLQKKYPITFNVEILRLYPPVMPRENKDIEQNGESRKERCVA